MRLETLANNLSKAHSLQDFPLMSKIIENESENGPKGLLTELVSALYKADDKTLCRCSPELVKLARRISLLSSSNE